ncbi:recombinase family protein [Lysinibacillus antri]|nr:recombinase family protein [Lysinibacillus antri]
MKERNLIIVYCRVSSAKQHLDLQISAAKRYLESLGLKEDDDFINYLDDHDISATKLKIEERPNLMHLIRLIKEGKVKTVIVYKRDRLARNFYEFVDITKLFIKYDVEVIYTASNEPPFKNKLSLEAFYGMFSQMEGQNIGTRTADARKQYPSKILGYKRITDNGNKPQYIINEDKKDVIQSLFIDFSNVQGEDEFLEFLLVRRKGLNNPEKIIKILTNPFYSGHYESKNSYQFLHHVEPFVSLELYVECKSKIDLFIAFYLEKMAEVNKQHLVSPMCGECGGTMKYRKKNQLDLGYFVCSSNHKRISIPVEEIDKLVIQTVLDYVQSISVNLAKKIISKQITAAQKNVQKALESTTAEYLDTSLKICTLDRKVKSAMSKYLEEIAALKNKYSDLEQDLLSLQILSSEITDINRLLSQLNYNFKEQELYRLIELIVDKTQVYETYVHIDLFLSSFVKESNAS